jgi:hypothetical protein
MRRTDAAHFALMLVAFGLAYVVPFELLVLSYVILGPAHYTTEISWLHDRKYFLRDGGVAAALVLVAIGAAWIYNASWFGLVIWSALAACAALTAATSAAQRTFLLLVAAGLAAVMYGHWPALAVVGILIPTVIHVSVFTLVFMTVGAIRSGSLAQALLIALYLLAIGVILVVPPSASIVIPTFAEYGRDYFGGVAPALGRLFGIGNLGLDVRLGALLGFIYTYHYLNWFIKAELVRWFDMPRARMALVGAVSVASTGLYFYDYALGFTVLLALGMVHVVLEFPLNALTTRQLGDAVGRALSRHLRGNGALAAAPAERGGRRRD